MKKSRRKQGQWLNYTTRSKNLFKECEHSNTTMQTKNENPRKIVVLLAEDPGELGVRMHSAAYEHLGLNFAYFPIVVKAEGLKTAIDRMRELNLRGASVTMPFKREVIQYLDAVDEVAEEIGAVNTIVNDAGFLRGYNCDWTGAVKALREACALKGKRAILVGAGGAARAIAYGLRESWASVVVFNRTQEKAEELAAAFGLSFGGGLEGVVNAEGCGVLINATSVGYDSTGYESPILPAIKAVLRRNMVVMDVVSVPLETQLLREAKAKGCKIVPGYRMLLHQAAAQFKLFTGQKAPFEVMEKAAREYLAVPVTS